MENKTKSIFNILSLVNLIIGTLILLFSVFDAFTGGNFCLRVDEVKGCGIWEDANLNIIIPSLFWIFAPVYYFTKKNKVGIYLNLLIFFRNDWSCDFLI